MRRELPGQIHIQHQPAEMTDARDAGYDARNYQSSQKNYEKVKEEGSMIAIST